MTYIIGLVVVGLFFLALHYFTDLKTSQKVAIAAIILAVISGAIAYNSYAYAQRDNMLNVAMKFNQNKTVHCNGVDVNNTNYTLSIGTYTFIGKENTPNYGQMISVSTCK